jgi:site-specific recombinase XerD
MKLCGFVSSECFVEQACTKAGISKVNPQTLRRSAATTMLESGIPIHVVSRIFGHASIRITEDICGHLTDNRSARAMEAPEGR